MLIGIEDGKSASERRLRRDAAYLQIELPIADLAKILEGKLDGSFDPHGRGCEWNRHAGYLIPFNREFEKVGVFADKEAIISLPFPVGVVALARLLDAGEISDDAAPCTSMFIERAIFDQLADEYGCDPIEQLNIVRNGRRHPILRSLAECLEEDTGGEEDLDRAYTEHIVRAIAIYMATQFGSLVLAPPPDQGGGLEPWQLRLARKELGRAFAANVPLREVATSCGLSLNHFSRAFRRSTGVSPHRWVLERRIKSAKRMMDATNEPLAEIAAACGFSDQSHLSRVFKSVVGITPNRWRLGAASDCPEKSGDA